MAKTSPVQRLRALNSLLSVISPSGPEQAREVRKAVEFYIDELKELKAEDATFSQFAEDILNIHVRGSPQGEALCFWTIDVQEQELLFLRAAFLQKLESLKHFRRSTVVVFGLQETVFREQKYWTKKIQSEYNEIRNYLEAVAAGWQPKGFHLNLIYI